MRENGDRELQKILQTYRKTLASAPEQLRGVEIMAEKEPEALKAYFRLRSVAFQQGALSTKVKHLIMLGINLVRRFEPGVRYHIEGALESGACQEEIIDVIATAMLTGAAPIFVVGLQGVGTKSMGHE